MEVNLATVIDMQLVVQDLAARWIQSYPCKTQTSQETEMKSSLGRLGSQKSFTLTVPWNLAKPAKP